MVKNQTKCHCRYCGHDTNHEILSSHVESNREGYAYDKTYQIVKCLGCETTSFREISEDIEQAYQISDDEWEIPTSINVYPKFILGHRNLDGEFFIPNTVWHIYREVLLALQEDALILASLGLRGTVEAVCNDLNIDGRNLEIRITKLVSLGFISKKDAERLHGIRFMGNDAAHEIKKPPSELLTVALKIVEHLLASVYILEKEIEGKFETVISDYSKFEELLMQKIKTLNDGDELPMVEILGRDIRRVKNNIMTFEVELQNRIRSATFSNFKLGKLAKYHDSRYDLQHYIVS